MNISSPARVRIKKDVIVRIYKKIEGKGAVTISQGQEVIPSDIIGTSLISSGFRIIKLADQLGVAPAQAGKYMKKTLGQRIYKDELLAQRSGRLLRGKKVITAPTDGVLDSLNPQTGELRMSFLPRKQDLPSGVYGVVEQVDKARNQVIIRTQASLIYGIFGSGKTRDGILRLIGNKDQMIGKSFISQKLDGKIIVGGSLVLKEAISSAILAGVLGIITGGINAKDYKAMVGGDIGISVVVCEGFGSIPIGEDVFQILRKFDGKFVLIDGKSGVISLPSFEQSCISRVRKTHLPPIQDPSLKSYSFNRVNDQKLELMKGFIVRVRGNSYIGEQGRIVSLDRAETVMPSGVKAFLATIETARRKIQVPVDNLEIIDYIH